MHTHVQEKLIQHVPLQHFSLCIYKENIIFGNKIKKKKRELPWSSENSKKREKEYQQQKKRSSTHAHSHISDTDIGKKIKANRTDISGTRMVSAKDRNYKHQ